MKRLFLLLLSVLAVTQSHAATEIITAHIAITNAPIGNTNTITVAGSTRTWTNDVSQSLGTLVQQTNSIPYSATNLWLQLGTYPAADGHVLIMTNGSNVVSIRGAVAEALSVSISSGWATLSFTTNTVSTPTYVVRVPFRLEGAQAQTNIASGVLAILQQTTNAFGTNWTALSNHMTLLTAQTAGNKTITNSLLQQVGVMLATNINGIVSYLTNGYWTNGFAENLTVTNLSSPGTGTSSARLGASSVASGTSSTAVGDSASAAGNTATALGYAADASGAAATSAGASSQATASGSTAYGNSAVASGLRSTAVGFNADASYDYSAAIGAFASALAVGQIRVGTTTNQVSIPGTVAARYMTNNTLVGTNLFQGNYSFPAYSFTTLGNGNNIAVDFGTNYYIRLDGTITADSAICGIVLGRNGLQYLIENNTGYTVTFAQNTVDPTPANRITTYSGTDLAIPNGGWLLIAYDSTESRWDVAWNYPQTSYATNAVASTDGLATNLNTYASAADKVPLQVHALTGSISNIFSVLGTNDLNVFTVASNYTATAHSNLNVLGTNLVSGHLRIPTGASAGYVLQSAADGTASWAASSAGGWTSEQTNVTVYASNTTHSPLTVQPLTGSTNHIQRWLDTNGTLLVQISSNGFLGIGTNVAPTYAIEVGGASAYNGIRFAASGSDRLWASIAATPSLNIQQSTGLRSTLSPLSLTFFTAAGAASPAILTADSASVSAWRNSTTPQTNRTYRSFTDASNGSWLEQGWDETKSAHFLRSSANGTGASAPVHLSARTSSETNIVLNTNGTSTFFGSASVKPRTGLTGSALEVCTTNATVNLSASATTRDTFMSEQTNAVATANTTDATVTTLYSFTPVTNCVVGIRYKVVGKEDTDFEAAYYDRTACFMVADDGTVSEVGADGGASPQESDATWDCDADTSGGAIRIRVNGAMGLNVRWKGRIEIISEKYQ